MSLAQVMQNPELVATIETMVSVTPYHSSEIAKPLENPGFS